DEYELYKPQAAKKSPRELSPQDIEDIESGKDLGPEAVTEEKVDLSKYAFHGTTEKGITELKSGSFVADSSQINVTKGKALIPKTAFSAEKRGEILIIEKGDADISPESAPYSVTNKPKKVIARISPEDIGNPQKIKEAIQQALAPAKPEGKVKEIEHGRKEEKGLVRGEQEGQKPRRPVQVEKPSEEPSERGGILQSEGGVGEQKKFYTSVPEGWRKHHDLTEWSGKKGIRTKGNYAIEEVGTKRKRKSFNPDWKAGLEEVPTRLPPAT
ncbi:unnamed protein product, partial [marine sediment metagenome]